MSLNSLPHRCMPILCFDLNDGLSGNEAAVGPCGTDIEHYAGAKMHALLVKHNLQALSTFHDKAATYFGERHCSQVDFLGCPQTADVLQCNVLQRAAHNLQYINT